MADSKGNTKRRTHGVGDTITHTSWSSMRSRCLNKNDPGYPRYGGRGITICERWSKYKNFLADMGERPSLGYSIDRIDVNGNYEPSNCRWLPKPDQLRNTTKTIRLSFEGKTMCLSEWARHFEIGIETLRTRYVDGLRPPEIFRKPKSQDPIVTAFGRTMSFRQWSKETGIKKVTLQARINRYGWSPERAVTTPTDTTKRNSLAR